MIPITGKQFRAALPSRVRTLLPEAWQHFHHRERFSIVQFWYREPACHFEVGPVPKVGVLEVGLHFELRSAARNAALHAFFDRHYVELRHEMGELWLEPWDRGWHKLYRTLPYESSYSEALLDGAATALASQIVTLQPLLDEALAALRTR